MKLPQKKYLFELEEVKNAAILDFKSLNLVI